MRAHFFLRDSPLLLPREKIVDQGVHALTTQELLHTILGSGSKHSAVKTLARKITHKIQSHKSVELNDLLAIKGMGIAKSCQVLAAIELVERIRPRGFPVLDTLHKVLQQLSELRYLPREQIVGLYLNSRMQLLLKETLAVGSVNQSVISPRDIFTVIKYHPVTHLVLAHNHPSGTATPSADDCSFTEIIQEAGHLLGVEVIDHVIVAKEEHYSFREQGKLKFE